MGNNGSTETAAFQNDLVTLPGQSGPAKWLAGGMGKDDDFLTLSNIIGIDRARAYADLLYLCERYNLPQRRKQIVFHLRSMVSVDGVRAHDIVQMAVGLIDLQDKKQKKRDERKDESQQPKR